MARSWQDVRRDAATAGLVDEQGVANARKLADESVRAHKLADIRKAQGSTQGSVAAAMHVTQARVSKIERGELSRAEIGTLEAYVNALGGKLRLVADFGDQTITMK